MNRVDSEVGQLRTALLHRPGAELTRLTPRNNGQLLFDGVPWVERAQEEHDAFAALLTARGVEVLLLAELLALTLCAEPARTAGIAAAVDARRLGHGLAGALSEHLGRVPPAELADVLMAGMTFDELPVAESIAGVSLVRRMHHGGDFVVDPLPNLLFTRDSSFWVADRVAITSLALPARHRETSLTELVYAHHPRFAVPPAPTGTRPHHWRVATCCCSAPGCWPWGSVSAPPRRGPKPSLAALSLTVSRTPC